VKITTPRKPPCPVCGSDDTFEFLHRPNVPVHQNLLVGSPSEARRVARGDLTLCLCEKCGFAFNSAFRRQLLDYGQDYDNSQDFSPAFDQYTDGLVRHLVEDEGVRGRRVVELGCGKGAFLRKLVAYPGSDITGHGFDPTYVGPEIDLMGRLRFSRSFFSAGECQHAVQADVVLCRHVIEHVEKPVALLRTARDGLARRGQPAAGETEALAFFETPCLEWILRNGVVWDFFYEHCSLFTAGSLKAAAECAGLGDARIRPVFGGQYLWLRANAGRTAPAPPRPSRAILRLARAYAAEERERVRGWSELVRRWSNPGGIAIWGAGAKGATFCNLVDPDCRMIACVIDVNPSKQGKCIAGTGHRILPPERLSGEGVAAVLVLNPNYVHEISERLRGLGSRHAVIDATHEAGRKACA
jgi:hypothetical protein